MTPAFELAFARADDARAVLEAAHEAAAEVLTLHVEAQLTELAQRYPKRRFRADSGMGSLSIGIEASGKREMVWIWNAFASDDHNPVFKRLSDGWETLLDDFARRLEVDYVNFTRDIVVTGARYQTKASA